MRPLDAERVQEADEVVGEHLHVVVLERLVGCPVPALVVVDDPEAGLRDQRRDRVEVEVSEPCAVDLHDRLTIPRDPVPHVDAVDLDHPFHLHHHLDRCVRGRQYGPNV